MRQPKSTGVISLLLFMHVLTAVYSIEPLRTRLVGGSGNWEGRVEVYYQGAWGTVCDDFWDLNDAHAVCHTLGYPRASAYYHSAHFGQGTGDIILDDLGCTGSESNLAFCSHDGYLVENCGHSEDAGVTCDGIVSVRLQGGSSSREGRVEVYYQGEWGTVCDDFFDLNDAHVACRMLGYAFAESFSCCAAFGQGSGNIILDDLQCTGEETTLGNCTNRGFGSHNCGHSEDVGVTCIELPVRLAGGDSSNEGRVEVNYEGSWGTVCDDSWDINDATVICRMLGYLGVSSSSTDFGPGTGDIILEDVQCEGSETHISQCSHNGYEVHNCNHNEDVGVICSGEAELKIRLVDGPDDRQGRVELYYFGRWGTVCHYGWTSLDSDVVCRMLGFLSATGQSFYSSYGRGAGNVILRQPRCSGNELNLLQCERAFDLGYTYCGHTTDLGVSCLGLDDLQVRLMGGESDKEGRVEILYQGTWGTVCDDNWDLKDSDVVCRMLGYERAESYSCCAAFGQGSGPIFLDEVECNGTESNIGHCQRSDYEAHYCDHSEDVGVTCIEYDIDECNRTEGEYPCDAINGECTNTHGSFICSCSAGYHLDHNDTCYDINECSQMSEDYPCDATNGQCENTDGSYFCTCDAGYQLEADGAHCIEMDRPSTTPSTTRMQLSTPDMLDGGTILGLSTPATYGLVGGLALAFIAVLLVCIIMTVKMRKYRTSANESHNQQHEMNPRNRKQNCYDAPQPGDDGYMEINVIPAQSQAKSIRNVQPDEFVYENVTA